MEENPDRRRLRCSNKCIILAGVFVTVITCSILSVILLRSHFAKSNIQERETKSFRGSGKLCNTKQCLAQAARILRNMDSSVNPCDDFYNFTCGNFMKTVEIPKDQTRALMVLENKKIVEATLLQAYNAKSEDLIKPLKDIKNFYHQCVNSETTKRSTYKSIIEILEHLQWPVLFKNWSAETTSFNWLEWEGQLGAMGLAPVFLKTELKFDNRNFSVVYISLDCTARTLDRKNEKYVQTLETVLQQFLEIIIMDYKGNVPKEITEFFLEVEKIRPSSYDISDSTFYQSFQNRSLSELKKYIDGDLELFLKTILPPTFVINQDTVLGTSSLQCVINTTSMLNKADKRKVANYMIWATIENLLWIVNNETRQLDFKLDQARTGVQAPMPLYKLCLDFIDTQVSELSSALYVKRHFSRRRQKKLEKLIKLTLMELKELVQAITWMDEETKNMAKEKVKYLKYEIDHINEIVEDKYLLSAYGDLEMTSPNVVQNVLNIQRTSYLHMMRMYHWSASMRNKVALLPLAHVVNAFYHPGLNSIAIPSGIAQGYIYSNNQEAYLNFGAIGTIIAHELSHMIDDNGRKYDAKGNYINWWTNQSNANFEQKSRCFVKQYDNFSIGSNLKINGTLTLGENMADSGGLILTYRAYLRWMKKYSLKKLPGLEKFTLRQMYWITVGNTWCDKIRPESLETFLKTDLHSVGNFRVQGPLSNSDEFLQDFKCYGTAKMNNKEKCRIW